MFRNLFIFSLIILLVACCKDEKLNDNIFWRAPLNQKSLIYDLGLGYPIYKNTVVFHSTPEPWGVHQSILHGLDTKTGKEKWQLTNKDFYPKKDLRFNSFEYFYQYDNIVVACDFVINPTDERYIYGIDIEAGKVLWVKELPIGYTEMGKLVRGIDKYAYIDAMNRNTSKFSLLKFNIETGDFSTSMNLTNEYLPLTITILLSLISACTFSDIYKNNNEDDFIACSINSWDPIKTDRWFMTLYIYNLTKKQKIYSIPVACEDSLNDSFSGRICYHNGKIIVGKGAEFLCFDAFDDKGVLWQHNTGIYANDNAMQVLGYDNLALGFTVDKLFAYDINTGKELYKVTANGSSTPAIIDGIIYGEDHNDFLMRDPKTGKELKRIKTGNNEEGFSSSRPNGADGKIFVHTYSDAYCIKAWGK